VHCLLDDAAKRIRNCLLLLVALAALTGFALPAWAAQTVRVGVYDNNPKVTTNARSAPSGIYIDIIEDIAKKHDWDIEYVPGTFATGMEGLRAGTIDLLPDVSYTAERIKTVAISQEPVLASWSQVYASSQLKVSSMLDLANRRVAVLDGSIHGAAFTEMMAGFQISVQIVSLPDMASAFQAVTDGKADAVVGNRFFGQLNAGKYGLVDTGIVFNPVAGFFGAPKTGRAQLLATIDQEMLKYKADPQSILYKSLKRWMVDEVRTTTPGWLKPVLFGGVASFFVVGAWILLLRQQVAARTRDIRQKNRDTLRMNRVLGAIGSNYDMQPLLQSTLQGALTLGGFDAGALVTLPSSKVATDSKTDLTEEFTDDHTTLLSKSGIVLDTALVKAHAAKMLAQEPGLTPPYAVYRVAESDQSVRNALWQVHIPLVARDKMIGILSLYSSHDKPPRPQPLQQIAEVCGTLALALENLTLYEELQAHSHVLEQRVSTRTQEIAGLNHTLQAIIDHVPEPIFYKDVNLHFQGCNQAFETVFGITRSQVINADRQIGPQFSSTTQNDYALEQKQLLLNGGVVRREELLEFADGTLHPTLYSAKSFHGPDGVVRGLVGAIVDLTELKKAESELQAANEEKAAIFQAADFGIALLHNRRVLHCNAALERMLGYGDGDLIGRTTRTWYANEKDYQEVGKMVPLLLSGIKTHQMEQEFVRKDGSRFWCRITGRNLDLEDPSKGMVGIFEDVTEARAVKEYLIRARLDAETADRTKSAFLATMSHELRTPLNSIIGFTGIVLQGMAGPLTDEQTKQLGMVRNSARHLLALINDVLDISKIEAGELRVSYEAFDVLATLEKAVNTVRPLALKKDLTLHVDIAPGIHTMHSDSRRVQQILLNLLSNAIKFTEAGSVTLKVSTEGNDRELNQTSIRFSVADTGIGIKPEDMRGLFAPFRQVDSKMSRHYDGTGLGLTICKHLAIALGGDIQVKSQWGVGSVFTCILPLKHPPEGTP
jgi:PAS domain S-box-containing protein